MQKFTLGHNYPVHLGSSFKNNSGGVQTIHAQFLPESVDLAKPGVISKKKDESIQVEFQNKPSGSSAFCGKLNQTKGDAVLIFDGTSFRIERVTSAVFDLKKLTTPQAPSHALEELLKQDQKKRKAESALLDAPSMKKKSWRRSDKPQGHKIPCWRNDFTKK